MKLYEITTNIQRIWDVASFALQEEGLDEERKNALLVTLENDLKRTEINQTQKCLDIACLIKTMEAESEAIKKEEEKLYARRKRVEKSAEWLRTYLTNNITKGTVFKDARATITWRNSKAVNILVKAEDLPVQYQRKTVFIEPNRTVIKEAIESGDTSLTGLATIEEKANIQIK